MNKIREALPESIITIDDFSSKHYENGGHGAHIQVIVYDKIFNKKSLPEQHKIIYKILSKELSNGELHALRIKTGSLTNE